MVQLPSFFSPAALLNLLAGSKRVAETRDVAYGGNPRERLDIYAPRRAGSYPVVVFFYGGSWEEGDRGAYRFVGTALAERGIVTVIPDYRVYPEVRFPGFLEDGAQAVRWVRDSIADYGGDPGRIVVAGHSAGAHIAAMLALDPQWLRQAGLDPRDLSGLVGLAGPYDFLPLRSETLKTIFGPEQTRDSTQPINFASAAAPPSLLIAGAKDTVVDPGNTTRLAARLREVGASVEAYLYPGVGHAGLVGAFGKPIRGIAPVLRETAAFVSRVMAAERVAA
jgi:acetyl esterase/lipase